MSSYEMKFANVGKKVKKVLREDWAEFAAGTSEFCVGSSEFSSI
jgi:hypothetical protein